MACPERLQCFCWPPIDHRAIVIAVMSSQAFIVGAIRIRYLFREVMEVRLAHDLVCFCELRAVVIRISSDVDGLCWFLCDLLGLLGSIGSSLDRVGFSGSSA